MIDVPDGLPSSACRAGRSGGATTLHACRIGAGPAAEGGRRAFGTAGGTNGSVAGMRPVPPAPRGWTVTVPEYREGNVSGVIRATGEAAP
jgi:hypothetical protein